MKPGNPLHGLDRRALVRHIDYLADEEVAALAILTGVPLVHEPDGQLTRLRHYYLA